MRINGVHLDVAPAGSGKPFIWSHGLMSSRAAEDEGKILNLRGLADVIRLIRYDMRGHGKSEATFSPEDYRFESYGKDISALADALGIERFAAGGASLGCAASIYASLLIPDRVEALVLVIPPTAWETRETRKEAYNLGAQVVESGGPGSLAALLKQEPTFPPGFLLKTFPNEAEVYLKHFASQNQKAAACILRGAALSDFPSKQELQQIMCPALILAWPDDPTHPLVIAEELKVQIPKSVLKVAEKPDDVRRWPHLIREFILGFH